MNQLEQLAQTHKHTLKDPYSTLYEMLGFTLIESLCYTFEGNSLYVPTLQFFFRPCIEKAVKEEFNGQNYLELAKKYDYSISTIREMLK